MKYNGIEIFAYNERYTYLKAVKVGECKHPIVIPAGWQMHFFGGVF